jgi:hypothetical protein
VPEERRELRHPPVDVLAGVVPVQQGADSKRVPEVVRPRAHPLPCSLQPDLPDQLRELRIELVLGEP